MSADRITLDTNILIYALDTTADKKHDMAIDVIRRAITCDCVLTLQVLSEFFNIITRKYHIPAIEAAKLVADYQELFPIVLAKQTTLKRAVSIVCKYKLAFWDAMLWAAAQEAGVTLLLSEDFQHEQLINDVRIVNPFVRNNFWNITDELNS